MLWATLDRVRRCVMSRRVAACVTLVVGLVLFFGVAAPHGLRADVAVLNQSGVRQEQPSTRDRRLHTIELLLPLAPDGSAQPMITVTSSGRPLLRTATSQHLAVELTDGRAELRVDYPSGLQLLTVVRASDAALQLPEVRSIGVSVLDSYGAPVPDARLEARGGGGRFSWRASVVASALGIVELPHPSSSGGPTLVTTYAEGFGTRVADTDLSETRQLTISLEATGTIAGTVSVRADKAPQIVLRLWRVDNARQLVLQQRVQGRFVLNNLAAGEYEVDFVAPRAGVLKAGRVVLGSGRFVDMGTVDVSPDATLAGNVQDPSGKPAARIRVRLSEPGFPGGVTVETYTDVKGRFRFARLIPGEYQPELFSSATGWQSAIDQNVLVERDEPVRRSFELKPSDCSVRIVLPGDVDHGPVSYSVELPVTDGPISVKVARDVEERFFASVPCIGSAIVRRLDGDATRYSVPLEPGEARLVVPFVSRAAPTQIRVLVGDQPLPGAALWATARNSTEVVKKARSTNVTDDNGFTLLLLPSSKDDLTVYLQRGRLLSVIERAGWSLLQESLDLKLPSRSLQGVARDSDGKAAAGASFNGHVIPDGIGSDLPASAVTVFKGVTNADGTFEAFGLAPGVWSIQFNLSSSLPPQSVSAEVDLRRSAGQDVTKLAVTLAPR